MIDVLRGDPDGLNAAAPQLERDVVDPARDLTAVPKQPETGEDLRGPVDPERLARICAALDASTEALPKVSVGWNNF